MKIHLLIAFFLSSVAAAAEHPRDFVPDDAMAILSISNGGAINSILNTINKQAGMSDTENYINDTLLKSLIDDPESVDLSSEILFVIAPPMYADGKQPLTMFGPMPTLIVICKAKEGRTVNLSKAR